MTTNTETRRAELETLRKALLTAIDVEESALAAEGEDEQDAYACVLAGSPELRRLRAALMTVTDEMHTLRTPEEIANAARFWDFE